jgi:hypothetical protein
VTGAALAERYLHSSDWTVLRSVAGNGERVKRAIGELLASESGEEAKSAYWGIENHAFVQGEIFEVAEACTSVLTAALADSRAKWTRVAILDLLYQIVSGHPSPSEGTPADILERCKMASREGLWLLFREVVSGERECALDVLDQLGEGERARGLIVSEGIHSVRPPNE